MTEKCLIVAVVVNFWLLLIIAVDGMEIVIEKFGFFLVITGFITVHKGSLHAFRRSNTIQVFLNIVMLAIRKRYQF